MATPNTAAREPLFSQYAAAKAEYDALDNRIDQGEEMSPELIAAWEVAMLRSFELSKALGLPAWRPYE